MIEFIFQSQEVMFIEVFIGVLTAMITGFIMGIIFHKRFVKEGKEK